MKRAIERRSLRILLTMILSVLMAVGGVLPGGVQVTNAEMIDVNVTIIGNANSGSDSTMFNVGSSAGTVSYCFNRQQITPTTGGFVYNKKSNDESEITSRRGRGATPGSYENAMPNTKNLLRAVLYYGYPRDGGNLKSDIQNILPAADQGRTDDLFRWATQKLIWHISEGLDGSLPNYGGPYPFQTSAPTGSQAFSGLDDTINQQRTVDASNLIWAKVKASQELADPFSDIPASVDVEIYTSETAGAQAMIVPKMDEGPSISNTTLTADGSTAGTDAAQVEIPSGSTSKAVALTDNVQWAGLDVSEGKTYIIKCELYNTESTTTPVATAQESGINQASGTKTVTFTPNVNLSEGTYSIKTTIYASDGTTKVVGPHNDNLKDKKETVEVTKAPGPTITPAKLKFTAQKSVIDADDDDADITSDYVNKFDFVLEQTAGPTVLAQPQTKKNASTDGKTVTFDEIIFDESIFDTGDTFDANGKRSKQFTFKVSENAGNEADIQYSTSSLTKQVTVTETRDATSGDCTFSITIDGTEGSGTVEKDLGTLTNTKKTVTPVKIRLVATKKVAGTYAPAIGEVANKFEFTLSGGGQNQTGKKNDSNGKITFEAMTLNVGQYDYVIRETAGTNGGITYHSGSRNVKIITKEVDGNVVIDSAKMGQSESLIQSGPDAEGVYTLTLPEGKEFTNTYKDPKVTNTTATANGTVAKDDSAATVTLDPGEEVNVTLTDSVEFEGFDADRKYIIVSEIYKDGETAAYKSKNTAVSGKSSGTETVTFDNLTAIGKYDIKTKVYYAKADDETMPDMEKPITSATHNDSLNINREKVEIKRNLPKIKISKTDLGYNEIEGASMKLTGGPDNIDVEWTSTGEAKEFEIKAGDYILRELIAPDEYAQVSTEMKFKVNEDGSVELKTTSVDSGGELRLKEGTTDHIILADARAFDIQISKKVLGGDEVAGAKMLLTGGPDNLTAPWVSTGEPEMFKLRAGDYVLTEEVAPKGLKKVTTKIRFTVTDDGTVANLTATVDNGGKVSVKGDSENHIILEDAPINPDITKTVNGGKSTTMKSEKDTVEFKLTSTVPYGVKEFVFKDNLPEPLLYVEDSIKATLGGQDLIQYNPDKGWFGYTATSDTDVVVEVLSPVIDGVEGPSSIPPEEAWGKEVVVTFKCKIDPDADLSDFKDPVVNVANVIVDGDTYTDTGDNKASVLGVYELADDEKDNGKKSKGANTGDDAPIGWAVVGILSAAFALDMMRRRRMNS